jgi:hypothetical protein
MERDYQKEAQFWQIKYFELLQHSTQVIAAMGRPMLIEAQTKGDAAK